MPAKKRPTQTTTTAADTQHEPDAPVALLSRFIAPMQSAGRLGKTTFVDELLGWCDHSGIAWQALDCDAQHATLSRRHDVPLFSLSEPEAIPRLLHEMASNEQPAPVIALDFPAQATDFLLGEFEKSDALAVLDEIRMRLTVPLFLVDDAAALESLAKVVKAFGDRADYVLVKNPARGPYTRSDASPLIGRLREAGAPTIELPAITQAARDGIQVAERKAGRSLPLSEVAPALGIVHRIEMEKFTSRVWAQMEDAAAVLLPDAALIQNRVSDARGARKGAAATVDHLDPLA